MLLRDIAVSVPDALLWPTPYVQCSAIYICAFAVLCMAAPSPVCMYSCVMQPVCYCVTTEEQHVSPGWVSLFVFVETITADIACCHAAVRHNWQL